MDINSAWNFEDGVQWSEWLERNHAKKNEAWVFIYKKRSSRSGLRLDKAVEEALRFGWIDGKMKSFDDDRFILRFSPRRANSIWSKANRQKAETLIAQGRMTQAGLGKIEEAKRNGLWDNAYSSNNGAEIPADLEHALSLNRVAWNNFHNLANTYRNMFLRWLSGSRNEAIRRQRIEEIVKRAELNQKVRYGKI